jgi:hypothetical protein
MTIAEFTAHQVREVIDECDFVKMKHPPLSADLPPNDYYLFPKLKKHLRGRHFSSDEYLKVVDKFLRTYQKNFF